MALTLHFSFEQLHCASAAGWKKIGWDVGYLVVALTAALLLLTGALVVGALAWGQFTAVFLPTTPTVNLRQLMTQPLSALASLPCRPTCTWRSRSS
ncbi:MAG: hypothetical protein DLM53_05970 [Candidatus Eremiobacter antarcticus]|nr:hypothetical protein [Candidatus Eremiobacteraeota bacterium]PZR62365.1 MAG: hypothetical protein DLM53_05970 [Candidatus Eremiobacter sp. RRmetagenome_bin22]